jgi:hypothetical protein
MEGDEDDEVCSHCDSDIFQKLQLLSTSVHG